MNMENLRSIVWDVLRSDQWRNQFAELHANAKQAASERNVEFQKDEFEVAANGVIWELLTRGILAPTGDDKHLDFRFLQVTDYGKKCIDGAAEPKSDPGQYIERLEAQVGGPVDETIKTFVRESLLTFLSGSYFASTVLLSIAAERCLELLVVSYSAKKSARSAFETRMKRTARNTRDRVETLRAELLKASLRGDLAESLELQLSGLVTLIRYSRDSDGNPVGRTFDRDTAHAGLLLFPQYCKWVYDLKRELAASDAKAT